MHLELQIKFQANMLNEFLNTVKYIPSKPRIEITERIGIVATNFIRKRK